MTRRIEDTQEQDLIAMITTRISRRLRHSGGIVQLVAILALALFLRPSSLGGRMDYVIVSGHSMLPTFKQFDLVAVRKQPAYKVGEVVAYKFEDPGTHEKLPFVIHRVKAIRPDGTYLMRGDNNDFDDPMYPTDKDVVGKAAFVIRKGGTALSWATSTGTLAILLGLGAALFGFSFGMRKWGEDSDDEPSSPTSTDDERELETAGRR